MKNEERKVLHLHYCTKKLLRDLGHWIKLKIIIIIRKEFQNNYYFPKKNINNAFIIIRISRTHIVPRSPLLVMYARTPTCYQTLSTKEFEISFDEKRVPICFY